MLGSVSRFLRVGAWGRTLKPEPRMRAETFFRGDLVALGSVFLISRSRLESCIDCSELETNACRFNYKHTVFYDYQVGSAVYLSVSCLQEYPQPI